MTTEARDITARIEADLKQFRLSLIAQRDTAAEEARKEAQALIGEALKASDNRKNQALNEIGTLKRQAAGEAHAEADRLAGMLVEQVLRGPESEGLRL